MGLMMTLVKIQLLAVLLVIAISVGYGRVPKKIIRGHAASISELPHQVSLQTPSGFHFCGGTIIDATHILTAAHCIVNKKLESTQKEINVVVGTDNLDNQSPENIFPVIETIHHSRYSFPTPSANDIAMLKVSRPIPFSAYQKPAKLPTEDTPESTRVISSGWGATSYNRETKEGTNYPQQLQELERIVVSDEKCRKIFGNRVTHGQICVFSKNGADSCTGDSGGPLTYEDTIIGITSWGVGCGLGYPDVYTRVYHYLPWIKMALVA